VKPRPPARRRWFKRWQLSDIRRRVKPACSRQWMKNSQDLCPEAESWIQATMVGGIRGSTRSGGTGVVRVTCVLTPLSPWGRISTIRSSWRSRAVAFHGSHALIGRRHGIGSASIARWQRHVPSRHKQPPLTKGVVRDLFAGPSSPMRSHQQRLRSTRWGPGWGQKQVWLPRRFFVRRKGPFLRPGQPQPEHRAQATVNDRTSDRDAAPKASLTVVSTVLLKIGPRDARERPQLYEARGEDGSSRGDILCPSGT
jgi:hypothetical protein